MKLLIVEDENSIRNALKIFLSSNGYLIDEAKDGQEALELSNMNSYDCILLDLNLPIFDGLEVAKKIREQNNLTPIIMLTARVQIYNKLEGFECGADDYITKPFDLKEVLARINAVVRRYSENKEYDLVVGEYKLNINNNTLGNDKVSISLSNKESSILEFLIRNKGRAISSEELLDHIWDSEVNEFTQTVKTHIKTLRKKLKNKDFIKTIKGKGYIIP